MSAAFLHGFDHKVLHFLKSLELELCDSFQLLSIDVANGTDSIGNLHPNEDSIGLSSDDDPVFPFDPRLSRIAVLNFIFARRGLLSGQCFDAVSEMG